MSNLCPECKKKEGELSQLRGLLDQEREYKKHGHVLKDERIEQLEKENEGLRKELNGK